MKKLALVGAAFVLSNLLYAQIQQTPAILQNQEVEKCSQHIKHAEMMQQDPERFASMMTGPTEPLESKFKPSEGNEKLTGLIYKIPVVFHIIHNNGTENISDAQIQDQLNILNRDYRKLNADANSVVAAFQGLPADVEIEFVFATIAPNGACFSGITRTVNAITSNGSDGQAQVNAVIAGNNVFQGVWAHNKYLNIYVCDDLGGAAGYTFNPNGNSTANASNMYYNGIFMLHDYTGSIGTSSTSHSRALTHEVGHWLNLSHVWGANNNPGSAGCGGTDNVQDTPDTQGSTSCVLTANTCSTDNAYWGFNQVDQVENYMDYSYCSKMFTQGQVDRMRTAIISSVGGRSNIWTTANLNLVGGVPGGSLCALDFTANDVALCAGDQATFTMSAGGAPITSYSWTFTGGTPSSSTAASPTVTYNTSGTYQVSLTIVSGGNSYTKTKTAYISVAGGTLASLPITEGFTAGTIPFTNWTLTNVGNTGTWTRSTTVGLSPTAGNSAMIDNYAVQTGDDELGLPNFSAASLGTLQMEFDVAYRLDSGNPTYIDGLEVMASGDCGATYTTVYSKSGSTLATTTSAAGSFTPSAGNAQWRHETINLNAFAGSARVILKMKCLSGYGNRMFVDNLNISGVANSSAPTANFSASASTVCAGQTVTFTNSSTGSGNTYAWSFPGGTPSTSTAVNPVVTYATAGTYNVSLTATNAGGNNTATQNNSITVNPIPATPTISAGGPTTFCQGGSVVLTSSGGAGSTWSNGTSAASITVTSSGTYTVTKAANGCTSATSAPITVTVNPIPATPTLSAGGATTFCQGGSVVLTSSAGSASSWSNGSTGTTITVTSSGTYTATQTASGCTSAASAPITVTVNPTPATPTISAGGPTTFCQGGSVVLTSSGGAGSTWSNGTSAASITVTNSGTYTVTKTANGCTSATSAPITVTVNPTPATPTLSAGGATTFCQGGSVVLTSSAGSASSWSNGSTGTSITVSTSGTYTATQSASGCTSAASTPITVTVNPTPAIPTVSAGGTTTFCQGGSVVLTSSAGANSTWSNGSTGTSITVTSSGTYTATQSASGCTSAASTPITVTVNPTPATPTVSAGGTTTFCQGGSVVLTSSAGANSTWSNGSTGATITVSTSGTYTATQSANGCTSTVSAPITVTVNPLPSISSGMATNPSSCGSSTGSIQVSGSGTGTINWTGTTSGSQSATLPAVIPNLPAGSYTVTFTNAQGCQSNSFTTSLTDPNAPATPVISATGPVTFCEGGSVTLNSSSSVDNIWSNGSGGSSLVVTQSGTYSVQVSTAGCTSGVSNAITVTVNPTPATPVISAGGPTTFCQGGSVVLTSSAGANSSWSNGNTGNSITVNSSGTYTSTQSVNGCPSAVSNTITVTVNQNPSVSFGAVDDMCNYDDPIVLTQGSPAGGTYSGTGISGNQFNPASAGNGSHTITYSYTDSNGCSGSSTSIIEVDECLGLTSNEEIQISIFPNPTNGFITVDSGTKHINEISVYDQAGRLILNLPYNAESKAQLDLGSFANGVYTLKVDMQETSKSIPVLLTR